MCDNEEGIITQLTKIEQENIGKILINLEKENIKKFKECIDNCSSPQKLTEQNQIQAIFNAFNLFPISETQILILGQDPYPNAERAHGLAFSFGDNKIPADDSLLNIFKAIEKYKKDNGVKIIHPIKEWETNLKDWASNNGVLLLNTALTYDKKNNKEYRMNVWRPFVKQIIINLLKSENKGNNKLVIFLWGGYARKLFNETIFDEFDKKNKKYKNEINRNILVLSTSHPSNNYDAVYKGFCYEAPNHFDCCDKFLGKYIWKNFPENNKKQ